MDRKARNPRENFCDHCHIELFVCNLFLIGRWKACITDGNQMPEVRLGGHPQGRLLGPALSCLRASSSGMPTSTRLAMPLSDRVAKACLRARRTHLSRRVSTPCSEMLLNIVVAAGWTLLAPIQAA